MARKQTTEDRSAEHRSAGADVTDQPGNARRSAKTSALRVNLRRIQRFFVEEHAIIVPFTVQEILEEQIGMKLV